MKLIVSNEIEKESKMNLPKISVVIPCFNIVDKSLTNLLNSINYPEDKILIVLVEILHKSVPVQTYNKFQIKRIFSSKRIGYAQAANMGIKKFSEELVMLVNPDVVLETDTLFKLIEAIKVYPQASIVAPKVLHDHKGFISKYDMPIIFFNPFIGTLNSFSIKHLSRIKSVVSVFAVSGCCMLFRKEYWEKVNGFNEEYFLYWEDTDYCAQAKRLNYEILWSPLAIVTHQGSTSIGNNNPVKIYYLVRNGLKFKFKFANFFGKIWILLSSGLTLITKFIKSLFITNKKLDSRFFIKGIIDFYLNRFGE